jgi:acetyltransferase-like isoleucine patch superfamily enzyme
MNLKRIVTYLKHEYLVRRRPVEFARAIGVRLGDNCRLLGLTRKTFGSEPYLVQLGDHVSLTGNVRFVTHDGGVWVFRDREPNIEVVEPIIVGNNVFIGLGSIILPGVHIGNNCVIGAGSVVNRDIPSNSVAAGCPAKILGSIDEYREKIRARALYYGDLPEPDKRALLEKELADRFLDAR